ncbi:hypothetical protein HNP88_000354 [Methanococcus maripaludis]|uniref:Uncharacterized protein n=1 Tax=Methanococcus maripaludis TaxID=39152 RepID=A0A7J9NMB6_METMI|nr:hypothetical protein [Methanococcus maripaludis]MBA2846170.1 hypothetical protein [Methanococcus maripaludis]
MKLFRITAKDELKYINLENVAKIEFYEYSNNVYEVTFYSFKNDEALDCVDLSKDELRQLIQILEKDMVYSVKSEE